MIMKFYSKALNIRPQNINNDGYDGKHFSVERTVAYAIWGERRTFLIVNTDKIVNIRITKPSEK